MSKKTKTPHLDFYMKYAQEGILPSCGLCLSISKEDQLDEELLDLFNPNSKEIAKLEKQKICTVYWGNTIPDPEYTYGGYNKIYYEDYHIVSHAIKQEFNEFRQNIVLFMAAMNNEL